MVQPLEVQRSRLKEEPFLVWNTFLQLLAESDFPDMSDTQAVAFLAFAYDGDVQNGGHLQFFEHRFNLFGPQLGLVVTMTLDALADLGASRQAAILSEASRLYLSQDRARPCAAEEYCDPALEEEFGQLDSRYYDCAPDLNHYLEQFLEAHMEEFVKLV